MPSSHSCNLCQILLPFSLTKCKFFCSICRHSTTYTCHTQKPSPSVFLVVPHNRHQDLRFPINDLHATRGMENSSKWMCGAGGSSIFWQWLHGGFHRSCWINPSWFPEGNQELISTQYNCPCNSNAKGRNLAEWGREHGIKMEERLDHVYPWGERRRAIKKEEG